MRERKLTRTLAAILMSALAAGPGPFRPALAWAQAPGPASPPPPVFGAQTAAVVVDVVVRDKKGNLVRDLTILEQAKNEAAFYLNERGGSAETAKMIRRVRNESRFGLAAVG